jgi:ubiquinone/menaquinone biosynthesis C-methylase UbiE
MASSYYGKFHARDRLLDGLGLAGDETLLDVGCGHGLLLIGAAKRLPRGRAVGIDLWSQVDQGNNSKEATLGNAELEGVADRVEIHTGDMRQMPFADATFDAVVANLAIHNVPSREGRRQAISEIVRVLTPGGRSPDGFQENGRLRFRSARFGADQCARRRADFLDFSSRTNCARAEAGLKRNPEEAQEREQEPARVAYCDQVCSGGSLDPWCLR